MNKNIAHLTEETGSNASKALTTAGDLNGDGKVDAADSEAAVERAKHAAEPLGDQAARLGREAASKVSKALTIAGDLNGDGKVDSADWEIAVRRAKLVAEPIGDEAARLGKTFLRADMTRDVATGAAVGAAIALPIPFLGAAAGAAVGAGLGLYKNLQKRGGGPATSKPPAASGDLVTELAGLNDLRQRGILTEEEFQSQKRKLLRR